MNRSEGAKSHEIRALKGKRLVLLCLVLGCFTFALYWSVLTHPFADYDDDNYVTANSHVQAGLNWKSVRWAMTSTEKSNWHPLTWISHELDCQGYGLNPAGHHFTSLGLHVINVLMLFLLLAFATHALEPSFLVAICFAIHPLNVESVVWIAERKNVLSTALFLLTIGVYGWYTLRPGVKRYAVVFVTFALSLASKPMVITLPCVALLLDYWPLQRVWRITKWSTVFPVPQKRCSQLFLEKLPLFLLSIGSAVVTIVAQNSGGSIKSLAQLPLILRAKNAIWAYAEYVLKTFWPTALAPHYPHPGDTLALWKLLLAATFLVSVSASVWRKRSQPYLVVGWCWFLGTLVPVIGLIQVGNQAIADRYMYIPIMGVLLMVVWGGYELAQRENMRPAVRIGFAFIILCGLSFLTYRQIGFWKSSFDLWSHTIAVTKNNALAENNLGVALMNRGDDAQGLSHFQNAERIDPADPSARLNVATVLQLHGQLRAARSEYLKIIEMASSDANAVANAKILAAAYSNLGTLYSEAGRYDQARETYQEALRISPTALKNPIDLAYQIVEKEPRAENYILLAEMLEQTRRLEEARVAYAQALKLDPTFAEAQASLERLRDNREKVTGWGATPQK